MAKLTTLRPGARIKKLESKTPVKETVNSGRSTWGKGGERGWKWQKLRKKLLIDHKFSCASCGRVRLPSQLDLDHIVNVASGGDMWNEDNLQLLCRDTCHKEKSRREAEAGKYGGII